MMIGWRKAKKQSLQINGEYAKVNENPETGNMV